MIDEKENKEYNIFKSKEELDKYTEKFSDRFTNGEVQFIDDKTYMWDGVEWTELKVTQSNSGISMSMYELNQQIIQQLPNHDEESIEADIQIVNNFADKAHSNFYMLLCKEASYYTMFIEEAGLSEFTTLGAAVLACAQDLGKVRSVEMLDAEVEIWVYDDIVGQMYCLHLFDYTNGIVTYGG